MGSLVVLPQIDPEQELPGLKVPEKTMIFQHNNLLKDKAPVMVEMVVSVTAIVGDIVDVGVVDGDTVVPVVHWTLSAKSQFFEESFQRRPEAQAYS